MFVNNWHRLTFLLPLHHWNRISLFITDISLIIVLSKSVSINQLIDTYRLTKYDDQANISDEKANPVPMMEGKKESKAMPIVDKHPVQARKNDVSIPQYVPLLGGVGTAGMIEMFRRLLKKKKEHG